MVKEETIMNDINNYWTFKPDIKSIRILKEIKIDNLKNEITLILTEWDEFLKLDYSKTKLFDGRYII